MRRPLQLLFTIVLTAGLVLAWLRLGNVSLPDLAAQLGTAAPLAVAAAAALSVVHLAARSVRWRTLLLVPGEAAPALSPLFAGTVVGYAVNAAVPGRLGEVVRPGLAWLWARVPAGRALASIVLERLLDIATLLALLLAFVALGPAAARADLARPALLAAAVAAAAGGAFVYLYKRHLDALVRLAAAACRALPRRWQARAGALAHAFVSGFDSLARPGAWWRLPALSALTWLPVLLALHVSLVAMAIPAPWTAVLLLAPLTAAGIAVPTPAGIGGFHAAMTFGLVHWLGAESAKAAAAAVVAHAAAVVPILGLGAVIAWRRGLRGSEVLAAAASDAPAPAPAPEARPGPEARPEAGPGPEARPGPEAGAEAGAETGAVPPESRS